MAKKASRPARRKVEEENIDLNNPEFIKAWELLQHTKQSIFLTGKAGTGKSTFLRYITAHTHKKHVVLAPTGIAAVNVGGVTLHSFFRIPFKPIVPGDPDFLPDRIRQRMKYPGHLVKLIREVELIIIDEISMVRADIIDFVDLLLRTYSGNQREPFGGKQLLFVGDVFQLEPVLSGDMRDILRKFYRDPFFFSAHVFDRIRLVPIELRKIYRQSEGDFVELLDRIRTGSVTRDDLIRLNTRCLAVPSLLDAPDSKPTMTLASRRDMVDHINETRLDAIDRPLVTFTGKIRGDFPENSLPTDLELSLKEGAQVVFIKNSPDKLWVNGTIGTVETLTKDLLEIRLENGTVHAVEPEKWSNIRYVYDPKTRKIDEEELGSFTQYPVKLAWALTIHKSQGLTFSNVIIDIGRGAFTGGQTYVALSRCRSFEGMTLRSTVADRDIFVNPAIISFSRSFNDPILIDEAMRKAHADECYLNAIEKAGSGDLTEAFDLFIEGTKSWPLLDDGSAMRLARRKLGVVRTLQQRVAELEARIEADSRRFADMAREYCSLGDDCRLDDMPLPAIANYDKALTLLPDYSPALYGRALACMTVEDYPAAIRDFETLLTLPRQQPIAPQSRSIDNPHSKNPPSSHSDIKKSESSPSSYHLNQPKKSESSPSSFLSNQPEKSESSPSSYHSNQPDRSESSPSSYHSNQPDRFDILIRMGLAYFNLSDTHNAMDRCLIALDLNETNDYPRPLLATLHSLLADIYDSIGDPSSAHHHRQIAHRLKR